MNDSHQMPWKQEAEWIQAARQGDERAFERIIHRYSPTMVLRISRRITSVHDRQDILQEAFLTAYRKLGQLQDPAKIEAWLCRIADSLTAGWHRRNYSQLQFLTEHGELSEFVPAAMDCETPHAELRLKAAMRAAFFSLRAHHQQVLLHHYFQGHSYHDTGKLTGLDLDQVKSRLQKARHQLKKKLQTMTTKQQDQNILDLDASDLSAFHQLARFSSTDTARHVIGGIHLDASAGAAIATDGRRLLSRKLAALKNLETSVTITPCKPEDFLGLDKAQLVLGVNEALLLCGGDRDKSFPIPSEDYPDYKQVFPTDTDPFYGVELTAKAFQSALTTILPHLHPAHPVIENVKYAPFVRIELNAAVQTMALSVSRTFGYMGVEDLKKDDPSEWEFRISQPVRISKPEGADDFYVIRFNHDYLQMNLDGIEAKPDDIIILEIHLHAKPLVTRLASKMDRCAVVMPIRV